VVWYKLLALPDLATAELGKLAELEGETDLEQLIKSIRSKALREALEWVKRKLGRKKIKVEKCGRLLTELRLALYGVAEWDMFVGDEEGEMVIAAKFNDLQHEWAVVFSEWGECVVIKPTLEL